jgi:hypothetical protein
VVVDARRRALVTSIEAEAGLGQIKFPPKGRFSLPSIRRLTSCTSSTRLQIVSCRRAIWKRSPRKSAFGSPRLYPTSPDRDRAYGASRWDRRPRQPLSAVDFEGGQHSPANGCYPSLAPAIVQALGRPRC